MKILVTGAAGFIGSHLAERLAGLQHEVIGLDAFTDYYARVLKQLNAEDLQSLGVPICELDLVTDDLTGALQGVEVIYHLAAQPGISATTPFEHYQRNNILATYQLLEACKRLSTLKCFINIATSSIYGRDATGPENTEPRPTSYYGVTKLAAEQLVLAYQREQGLPACSLRLFSVYGPRERPEKLYPKLIGSILNDTPFPLFEGSRAHSRSFTYVGDIVDGFVATLNHLDAVQGEIINIGTDVEHTTGEAIDTVESIIGKKANVVTTPKRPGDQFRTHANIDKARRLLGYAPSTSLRQGLEAMVEWYTRRIAPLSS